MFSIYSYYLPIEKEMYFIDNNFYNNKCSYIVIIVISLMLLLKQM